MDKRAGNSTSYVAYAQTFCANALMTLLRRKRTLLAAMMALAPVLVPLLLAISARVITPPSGNLVFVKLIELVYLKALAPLLALFFGCALIGEDVEAHTMPYVLTRPVPRSAIVVGRFAAYMLVAAGILLPAVALNFAACTTIGGLSFSPASFQLLGHYMGVTVAALAAYGALCELLGALAKRPIIIGLILLFGWQRLALYVPGYIDFMTIEKYLNMLLPRLATEREKPVMRAALMEFQKTEFLIGGTQAAMVIVVLTALFLFMTAIVIRLREYTAARAAGA